MPELISKIPIGFNLEGYNFLQSSTETTGSSIFGGVDTNWEDGTLVDGRWLADNSLKQVQVQTTCFQSAPLQYTNEGKKYYGEVQDKADTTGDHPYSITGEAAFAGSGAGAIGAILYANDINNCNSGKLSTKLQEWANNLSRAESGRKDFYVGAAIAVKTLSDYLNHFYNLGIDGEIADKLAQKGIVCAETLFNLTGSQGKAYRIKVVDAASRCNATRGTAKTFNHQGQYYQYDVLDINISLLLTNDFSEIAVINSKELSETVNAGNLIFPWASAGYNYKKAQIPGYGPSGIASLGLTYESKFGTIISGDRLVWKTKGRTNDKEHSIARVRFFVDPENKQVARSVIPNLPDEFFNTNYADRGTAYFNTNPLANYASVGAKLADYGAKIMKYARYLRAKGLPMKYGGGGNIQHKDTQPKKDTATLDNVTNEYYIPMWRITNGVCDCDVFVNWVLLESGIVSNASIGGKHSANQWNAAMLNQYLNPGYKAIAIPDITQAEMGDILIYGKGQTESHAAILDSFTGGSITGYGMGTLKKASGNSTIPCNEPASSDLIAIIRIGQTQSA